MKNIFFPILGSLMMMTASAQPGTLDASFGDNGIIKGSAVSLLGNQLPQHIKQAFTDNNGNILFAVSNTFNGFITKRLNDGSIDMSYGHGGYSQVVPMLLSCAAMQTTGKIIVGGTNNRSNKLVMARYNTDGTLDAGFGNNGIYTLDIGSGYQVIKSIVITPLDEIIAGGEATINGSTQFVLAGFTPGGLPDYNFGTGGITTTSFNGSNSNLSELVLENDGKLVAAGSTSGAGGLDFALAKYLANGKPDFDFNSVGYLSVDFGGWDAGNSVVTDHNLNIYFGGNTPDANGFNHFRVACFKQDGTPNLGFNEGMGSILVSFGDSYDDLKKLQLLSDESIIVAGETNISQVSNDLEIVHIKTDGTLDTVFGNNGLLLADFNGGNDYCDFLKILPNDELLTGGGSQLFDGNHWQQNYLAFRFDNTGAISSTFASNGVLTEFFGSAYNNYDLAYATSELNLTVIGNNGNGITNYQYLNRFDIHGLQDTLYGTNGVASIGENSNGITAAFQPDGKLLVGSSINFGQLKLTRYNYDGTPDNSFGTNGSVLFFQYGDIAANTISIQPDGMIVLGLTKFSILGGSDILIARLQQDGSLDTNFGIDGIVKKDYSNYDYINSVALTPNGNILVGELSFDFAPDFSSFSYTSHITRLTSSGQPDQNFGDAGTITLNDNNAMLRSLFVQSDSKIVYGYTIYDSNTFPSFMQRLNENGTADITFGTNGKTILDDSFLSQEQDDKILITSQSAPGIGTSILRVSRFTKDGITDPTFGNNGNANLSAGELGTFRSQLLAYKDKAIFVSGQCQDKWGVIRGYVAKLLLESSPELSCHADTVLSTDLHQCSAVVNNIDPVALCTGSNITYSLSGATTGNGTCTASGVVFNKGITSVTYTLNGETSCGFKVSVNDLEEPAIANLVPDVTSLWPADKKMHDILLNYSTSDNCGIAGTQVYVASNEPVSVNNGDPSPDCQIVDAHHIRLRAQRLNSGNGRIYTITVTSTDVNGNTNSANTNVYVPRNQSPAYTLNVTATPNPSNNNFSIALSETSDGKPAITSNKKADIKIFNSSGILVSSYSNVNLPGIINIGDKLAPGVYYLEAIEANSKQTLKLIKL